MNSYDDQPIGFGDRKPRDLVPAGWHECAVTGVYNVGRQFDEYNTQKTGQASWRTIIKLKFESATKRPDGKQVLIYHEVTGSLDSRAKLRAIVHAVERRDLTDQEAGSYRLSQLLGKPLLINVTQVPKKTNPNELKEKINATVPTMNPHTPTQTPELWDWRSSNPDDAPNWVWDMFRKSKDFKEPAKPRVPRPRGELGVAAAGVVSGLPSTPAQAAPTVSGIEDPPF